MRGGKPGRQRNAVERQYFDSIDRIDICTVAETRQKRTLSAAWAERDFGHVFPLQDRNHLVITQIGRDHVF